jgi:HD-GYP domain-containing protein (c-di-GMP phosphodiesterase class II)
MSEITKEKQNQNAQNQQASIVKAPDSFSLLIPKSEEIVKALGDKVNGNFSRMIERIDEIERDTLFDKDVPRHSVAVAQLSIKISRIMNLASNEIENITYAGLLHDLGKEIVPCDLMKKSRSEMSKAEWAAVQGHTVDSAILANKLLKICFDKEKEGDRIDEILMGIQFHHERCDGTGYPMKFGSDEIHKYAKILAVPDVFDAMTHPRPYRNQVWTKEEAIACMNQESEKYDHGVLNAFAQIMTLGIENY